MGWPSRGPHRSRPSAIVIQRDLGKEFDERRF